jgi:predicted nucleic acid-binding protein
MTTFFDTSALLAAINPTEPHHLWSQNQLVKCKAQGPVVITDMVYCEFSIGMATLAEVDQVVQSLALDRYPGNDAILFRAGKAFLKFKRQNRGHKTTVLPDFFIGAAAEVSGAPLVTANARDFVTYFPMLKIIGP